MIIKAYKELPIYRGKIDRTGIGDNIYEDVHAVVGDRVEGVQFTQESKEILAIDVKRGLEQKEFLLSNDKDFHMQIHSIKRIDRGGGKHFSYDASRDDKGHADSFWAWALANSAVVSTDNKSMNFYAQRKQKKMELQDSLLSKTEKIKKELAAKEEQYKDISAKMYIENNSSSSAITKGKSLKQINNAFGFEKPDKDNW